MSRDGSGVYHRPVGTDAVTDTTIESTKYNVNVADVEQDLNLPRPIVAGGTGATTPDSALQALSAEKAKQIVTNYDSQVWLPGSFYSATTALGTIPVAVHAFAGIAYYANASDFVLEATDLTDANNATYRRVMTAGVWGPWVLTSSAGGSSTATSVGEYTFNTAITFPPAAGEIRFNNATQNSTTEVFLSHLTAGGADVTHMIPFTIRNGSELNVQDKVDATKWKVFAVTVDPVLSGGDYRFTVTLKNNANDLLPQRVLVGATSGGAVRYDIAQTLTTVQKAQARANIDVLRDYNYIINGAMKVSQENGSTSLALAASLIYPVDQFFVYAPGFGGVANTAEVASLTPGGSSHRLRVTVTTADTSVAVTDAVFIGQQIEGVRTADLKFGSANAKMLTIKFGCKAPAGTYSVTIRNYVPTRSYVSEFVISAGEANTDVVKQVTLNGDTTGVWLTDTSIGISITWSLMGGLNFQGPVGIWTSGNFMASANQFNFMGTVGNVFELFDVGLYEGNAAPEYRVPDFANELALCRRYFQSLGYIIWSGYSTAGGGFYTTLTCSPPMRAAPTITIGSPSYSNASAAGLQAATPTTIAFTATLTATGAGLASMGFCNLNARM